MLSRHPHTKYLDIQMAQLDDIIGHRKWEPIPGLILGLFPANERQRYFVMMSLIGWAQT